MGSEKNEDLKNSAVGGMFWIFGERLCAKLVSLAVSIVLARLLIPEDYSLIGIVAIFFTFGNVLIIGGLNTALIQKKGADSLDYSSVLCVTLAVAAVLYTSVFFCAPLVARLYNKPLLVMLFRVMGLNLFVNAVKSVVNAYTSSHLQFKQFFFATIVGTVISAAVGILMALSGFGVWALVAQEMTNSAIDTVILLFCTHMKLTPRCSLVRLKGLFSYGWKNLVSTMIGAVYDQLNPLIIGLRFTPTDLAFYTKGNSFPGLIRTTLTDTMSQVLFPVMAKVQDNLDDVRAVTRRYIQLASYVIFPVMVGLLAVSDTFVTALLTEKWAEAAVYIRFFCVVYMFDLINVGNIQAIKAIGRSDIVLKLEIIKKVLFFLMTFVALLLARSPHHLAMCSVCCTFAALAVNTFPNRTLIGYRYRWQLLDIAPNLLLSGIMAAAVLATGLLPLPEVILMLLQILVGAAVYVLLSILTKNPNFFYLLEILKRMLRKG